VATSAAPPSLLMLRPSAAGCPELRQRDQCFPGPWKMNRGPVGGARLWGPVVNPLLHAGERGGGTRPALGVHLLERRRYSDSAYTTGVEHKAPPRHCMWPLKKKILSFYFEGFKLNGFMF